MLCQSGEFVNSAIGDRRMDEGENGEALFQGNCGFILPGKSPASSDPSVRKPPILPSYVYRFDGSCLELRPFMEPGIQRSTITDLVTMQRLDPVSRSPSETIFGVNVGYTVASRERPSTATLLIVSHDPQVLESRFHMYLPFSRLSSAVSCTGRDLTVLGSPVSCHLTDAAVVDGSTGSQQYLVGLLGMKDSRLVGMRIEHPINCNAAAVPRPVERFEICLTGMGQLTALESFSPGYRSPLVFAGGSSGRLSACLFHPKSGFAPIQISDVDDLLQPNVPINCLRYLRIGSHELLVVGQGSQQHRPVVTVLALKERKVSSTSNRQNTAVLEFHRIGQEFAGRNKNGTVSALSASQPGTNEQSVAILACFCLGSGETRVSELLCGSISDREFALQSKHPIESVNSEPVSDIFVQDPESNLAHLALFSQLCYFMGEKQLELRTTATGTASSSLQMNVLKRWLKFDSPVNIYSKKETFAAIQQARKSMLDGMLFIDLLIDFFGVNASQMYPPRDSKTFTELVEVISAHPEMELLQKHCIFYYLTKDNSEDGDSAGFAAHFALQPHYRMLIDGYWSMDHGGYEDAIFYFSDPLVEADWPDKILQTLFAAERYKEALYFLQVVRPTLTDPHDFSIHMDLLLANDINDAFEFQRANAQKMPSKDSLLLQLLEYAFNNGEPSAMILERLAGFAFDSYEESVIVRYCSNSTNRYCKDFLVIFFVLRNRRIDAIKLYGQLRAESAGSGTQQLGALDILIDHVTRSLSAMEVKLLEELEGSKTTVNEPLAIDETLSGRIATKRSAFEALRAAASGAGLAPLTAPLTSTKSSALAIEPESAPSSPGSQAVPRLERPTAGKKQITLSQPNEPQGAMNRVKGDYMQIGFKSPEVNRHPAGNTRKSILAAELKQPATDVLRNLSPFSPGRSTKRQPSIASSAIEQQRFLAAQSMEDESISAHQQQPESSLPAAYLKKRKTILAEPVINESIDSAAHTPQGNSEYATPVNFLSPQQQRSQTKSKTQQQQQQQLVESEEEEETWFANPLMKGLKSILSPWPRPQAPEPPSSASVAPSKKLKVASSSTDKINEIVSSGDELYQAETPVSQCVFVEITSPPKTEKTALLESESAGDQSDNVSDEDDSSAVVKRNRTRTTSSERRVESALHVKPSIKRVKPVANEGAMEGDGDVAAQEAEKLSSAIFFQKRISSAGMSPPPKPAIDFVSDSKPASNSKDAEKMQKLPELASPKIISSAAVAKLTPSPPKHQEQSKQLGDGDKQVHPAKPIHFKEVTLDEMNAAMLSPKRTHHAVHPMNPYSPKRDFSLLSTTSSDKKEKPVGKTGFDSPQPKLAVIPVPLASARRQNQAPPAAQTPARQRLMKESTDEEPLRILRSGISRKLTSSVQPSNVDNSPSDALAAAKPVGRNTRVVVEEDQSAVANSPRVIAKSSVDSPGISRARSTRKAAVAALAAVEEQLRTPFGKSTAGSAPPSSSRRMVTRRMARPE